MESTRLNWREGKYSNFIVTVGRIGQLTVQYGAMGGWRASVFGNRLAESYPSSDLARAAAERVAAALLRDALAALQPEPLWKLTISTGADTWTEENLSHEAATARKAELIQDPAVLRVDMEAQS